MAGMNTSSQNATLLSKDAVTLEVNFPTGQPSTGQVYNWRHPGTNPVLLSAQNCVMAAVSNFAFVVQLVNPLHSVHTSSGQVMRDDALVDGPGRASGSLEHEALHRRDIREAASKDGFRPEEDIFVVQNTRFVTLTTPVSSLATCLGVPSPRTVL
ncbi:hypothetical protein CPB86DRAFT_800931 [Serendipita vermifera]|nr:hypothetical protein CPB86DRAFT_800931 [Serendipita vermifera]